MARMSWQQIIDMIQVYTPHNETATTVYAVLNHIQDVLFREAEFPNVVERIVPAPGRESYSWPARCPPDRVREIYLEENRREITTAELTAYVGQPVNASTLIYDLNKDGVIDAADIAEITSRGGTIVLDTGTKTPYEFEQLQYLQRKQTHSFLTDSGFIVRPIPERWGGSVLSATILDGGQNYDPVTTVTIVGDGSGATADVTVVNGKIAEITIKTTGKNYTYPPLFTFSGGAGTGATAYATIATERFVILYSPAPVAVSALNLNDYPSTPDGYDLMYVQYGSAEISKTQKDGQLADAHTIDGDKTLGKMQKQFSPKTQQSFRIPFRW